METLAMEERATHRWIDTKTGLDDLLRVLEDRRSLALDSESNSGFAYQERLCLLQINDGTEVWLLDLLALPGGNQALEPIRPMLEDPDYEIQLHGGEFDVGCLKRDYGITLAGLWDSQQAASFLGWPKTGYGAVVEEVCGVSLPKAHTLPTTWRSTRPAWSTGSTRFSRFAWAASSTTISAV